MDWEVISHDDETTTKIIGRRSEGTKTLSVSRSDDDGISTHFVVQNRAKRVIDDSSLRSLS